MTTTTMENSKVTRANKHMEPKESAWPKGSIKTMFGLFAACVIGAGLVLLGVAELVMAIF